MKGNYSTIQVLYSSEFEVGQNSNEISQMFYVDIEMMMSSRNVKLDKWY